MTVSSTTNRNGYTGNDSTATYAYSFKIFETSDLVVIVTKTSDNTETTLTLTTDYTVSGAGDTSGGNIVLVDASQAWMSASSFLDTGYTLAIRRVLPLTQLTDIRNQGAFYPEGHEDQFDKLLMVSQQQQDEIDRASKLPESVDPATFDTAIPVPEASKILGVNVAGDGFFLYPVGTEASNGDIYGPGASTDNALARYDGATGKLLQNSVDATLSDTGALDVKTLGIDGGTAMTSIKDEDDMTSDSAVALVTQQSIVEYIKKYQIKEVTSTSTTPYTLGANNTLLVNASGGNKTVNLPAAASSTGREYTVIKTDSTAANSVTLDGNGSETINGATTLEMTGQYSQVKIISDGSNWYILNYINNGDTWISYTPTTQGFGTIASVNMRYKIVTADTYLIQGVFTAGTPTAVEGQLGLPNSKTINSFGPVSTCGAWFRNASSASNGGNVICTPGDAFVNFSSSGVFTNTVLNAFTPVVGTGMLSASDTLTLSIIVSVNP